MPTDLSALLLCLPPGLGDAVAPWLAALPPVPAMALAAVATWAVAVSALLAPRGD